MRSTLVLLFFGLMPSLALAGPLRAQVLPQLQGIEDAPAAESLRALGPGVDAELMEIFQDSSQPRSTRARALHALGWFPTPESRLILVGALDGEDRVLARKAVTALGEGWGADALPELGRALGAADVHTRESAARALGNLNLPEANALLEARLKIEDSSTVQQTITTSLGR